MAGNVQQVRFTRVDGHPVAWSAVGTGPPLVIGGWWSSHLELDWRDPAFRALVELLARHRTVVRYDRPGTGLSGRDAPPPAELDAEVAVLDGVLDAVAAALGPGPVALWGASSGAPVAAALAARHPARVAALVLYGSYADGSRIAPPRARAALVELVAHHWGLGSRALTDLFLPGAAPAEREAFARFQRASAAPADAARSLAAVYAFDVRDALPRVTAPTLVLHRADDRAIPVALGREVAALVPGAVFTALEGTEHFPWRGDAGAVARAVLGFLGVGATAPDGPPPALAAVGGLSGRELEVLRLVAQGRADREIARLLVLSPHTVHRHVANVRAKLDLPSRAAAAAFAVREGLI
ncbi:alpha/beta fold hydrolase [Pseudonocardia broussonetiae]